MSDIGKRENGMKLTKNWQSNKPTQKIKRIGAKPKKIPFQLLGLPGPTEKQKVNSIDEVRRQAVLMSSGGFREALQAGPSTPSGKANGGIARQKPRRGAKK